MKRTIRIVAARVVSFGLVATLIACQSAEPLSPKSAAPRSANPASIDIAAKLDAIDAALRKMEQSDRFSGAVALEKDGEVVFKKAYGLADRESQEPNRVDTQFNIASIGKMFTGVAVVQLVEDGLIDLNEPIGTYLPWLPERIGSRVTTHHLLTHTSGLHNFFSHPRYRTLEPRLTSVAAYKPFVMTDRLEFRSGDRFLYSNTGYVVLGMIIEAVAGEDYYDYVQRNIFDVAGMDKTAFLGAERRSEDQAVGYTMAAGKLKPNWETLPPRGSPAGGVYSTLDDMLSFAEALQSNELLDAEHTRLATSRRFKEPDGGYGYGFGVRLGFKGDPPSVAHNGGAPGIAGEFTINPGLGYTFVLLSNLDPPLGAQAVDLILNELRIP